MTPEAMIFAVPRDLIASVDRGALLKASKRVEDRGGSIALNSVDRLDYRVGLGADMERLAPGLVAWMEETARSCGRRLDRSDPEFVALNVVPPGGAYSVHLDTTTSAVLVVFLTAVIGGELTIPERGITIRPTLGTAVFLRGRDNPHGIDTVLSGIRMSLVANLSGEDDQPPPEAAYE